MLSLTNVLSLQDKKDSIDTCLLNSVCDVIRQYSFILPGEKLSRYNFKGNYRWR